ncbi:MAG: alpha-glucosidase C-terminal domain-containing protein, partial [Cyclobacteriaceae bacterium]|nr:alpha-glucosidase C-terminal domain-containing protein [Cyclobacteriaceae bacterium]
QGDEIGMTNTRLSSVDESRDIETINGWREARKQGVSEQKFLQAANYAGRDNARTPMQWDNSAQAGFTQGIPWMPVNVNKENVSVDKQDRDPYSVLNYFRSMTALRKKYPGLVYGRYVPVQTSEEKLFIYERHFEQEKWLIVLNFSNHRVNFPHGLSGRTTSKIIGNYGLDDEEMLRSWEASIYIL